MKHVWFVVAAVMGIAIVFALVSMDHSRYETKTTDGLTVRIDKKTGATDLLARDEGGVAWHRIVEATPTPTSGEKASPEECARIRAEAADSAWGRDAMLQVKHCI